MENLPLRMRDIMGISLDGFQLVTGYYLKTKFMQYPAVHGEHNEIAVFLDKEILQDALKILPHRKYNVRKVRLLATLDGRYAFSLVGGMERSPFRLIDKGLLAELRQSPGSIRWIRGFTMYFDLDE